MQNGLVVAQTQLSEGENVPSDVEQASQVRQYCLTNILGVQHPIGQIDQICPVSAVLLVGSRVLSLAFQLLLFQDQTQSVMTQLVKRTPPNNNDYIVEQPRFH
jgi:hypothetical protein